MELDSLLGRNKNYISGSSIQTEDAYPVKVRSLREQLQNQIAYHQYEIEKLENAINALSPDVERALDALAKL